MIRVSSLPPAMALSPLTHLDSFFDLPPKHCIISFTDPVVPVTSDSKFGLSYETHSDNPRQFCFLTVYKSSGWASSRFYFSSGSLIRVWGVLVFVTFTHNLLDTTVCSLLYSTQLYQWVQFITSPVSCLCLLGWIAISQLSVYSPHLKVQRTVSLCVLAFLVLSFTSSEG